MFGHCVSVFYAEALDKHAETLKEVGANVNNGLADVLEKLDRLPAAKKAEIEADIAAVYATRPALAMVDSRKGITNLHVPNDVIVDASMPNVVRDGGRMWNDDDQLQDTVAMVPDRCYATIYQTIIEDAKQNGQFDPATMGDVSNVGLMAQKAEEYGSHDKTFIAPAAGTVRVSTRPARRCSSRRSSRATSSACARPRTPPSATGSSWPSRAPAPPARRPSSGSTQRRGHDAQIITKVKAYLPRARHDRPRPAAS